MFLGQITAYFYPFGVGLLLGLMYDTFEAEWYGSAIADSARPSYRLRLILKNAIVKSAWSPGPPFDDRRWIGPLKSGTRD
jgi:hypothetical protein